MKKIRYVFVLIASLTLLLLTAFPALADKACQDVPYDFVHSHTLEFSPGDWSTGTHTYQTRVTLPDGSVVEFDPVTFEVADGSPLITGQVLLRYWGLLSREGPTLSIHPDQDTAMQISWTYELDMSMADMKTERDGIIVEFRWDGGDYMVVTAGPIRSYCAVLNNGNFMRAWGGPLE